MDYARGGVTRVCRRRRLRRLRVAASGPRWSCRRRRRRGDGRRSEVARDRGSAAGARLRRRRARPISSTGPPPRGGSATSASTTSSSPSSSSAPGHAFGFAESGGNLIDAGAGGRARRARAGLRLSRRQLSAAADLRRASRSSIAAPARSCVARGHDSDDADARRRDRVRAGAGRARAAHHLDADQRGQASRSRKLAVGDAVEWGRAERFVPKKGLDAVGGAPRVDAGWVAGFGDDAALRLRRSPKGRSTRATTGSGPTSTRQIVDLPPGASVKVARWLVVGAPTDTSLYEALAALRRRAGRGCRATSSRRRSGEPLAGRARRLRRSRRRRWR